MKRMFSESKERFSIRKYTIGVASVLLSTLVFVEGNVYADEVKNNTESQTSVVTQENQGERHKESGLEANEVATPASTSVAPVESASPTSQASAEAPAHVVKGEKTEKQSNEVATPASTSVAPVESASPTSKASAEASSSAASEKKTEAQPTTRSRRSKRELPSSGGATTYVKTGDTITVQNPDVEVNFPNGNGLFTPVETVIRMNMPDSLTIKRNDKLVVDIPDAMRIPTSLHYDVTGPDGQVIGNAFLDSINNKVITTFTDYFEKNTLGKNYTLNISTGWKANVKPNVPTELNFNGTKITVTVGPENAPTPAAKSKVEKYGEAVTGHPELIRWTIRVNAGSLVAPQVLNNYQLIDSLPDDQELVQDGDPVLKEFDDQRKAAWRAGHATPIPDDHVDLWNGKALRAEKVQSISPWVSKGNAIQLLENIKTSSSGFSFKIAQLNEMIYVRYMTRLKNVSAHPTLAELQQKHGNDIKITYNNGEEYSYQASFAFKAGGSGSATKAKKPARVDLSFTKRLDGRNLKRGEFTFNLIDSTGKVVDTQTNDSFGNITFNPLLFNSAGTYHYTVEEVTGSETGMTYDPMKANVTITVNANGDSYVAQTTMPTDTEFNNTFKSSPVKVNLEFNKELSNGTLKAGDFSFTLAGDNNVNQTVTNKANGKITFSELSFDKVGVYNYTVKEVKGNKPDVDYDEMTVAVKVTVTKDEDSGLLTAKTEMTATGGEATGTDDTTFNNHVVPPVNVEFDFSKKLKGRDLKANEFTFKLYDESGAEVATATNDATGNVKFTGIEYSASDLGTDASGQRNSSKTFNYTVKEVIPTTPETGMTYDQMEAKVTVTVTKSGHTLVATAPSYSSTNGVDADGNATTGVDTEFNNTFTPTPVKVNLEFNKSLSNGTLNAGDFSFTLAGDNNVNQTVTNKADGKITFSELSFDREGVYNYTVKEVKGDKSDVDYDEMTVAVKVTVTKDATTGLLSAKTEMTSSGGEATDANDRIFNNHVVAPVKTRFDFSKALAGRQLQDDEFTFVLKDASGNVIQTKKNKANGVIAFDDLTFTNAQVGTHKYTVEEVQGSLTGVTYDTMKAEVTVAVTKSGHALTAVATLPTDTEFNNTFTPAATSAQFSFTKKLEGKALEADAFTFELLENGHVIQTKKNKADGTIQFDAISYATEGTHTYTVREVAGTDTNIDYDSMNATVTVNVTKDAQTGLLNAAVTMPADSEFNNYAVAPVTAQFDFSKALAGRTLKAGEFSFVLKDKNGTVLQTKTNDASGKVAFDALTYKNNEVGEHKYTVEEVAGSEAGMTYDPMKAEVTVTVTKDGHTLTATKALPTDTEFNNTFTPAATSAQFSFTKKLEGKALEADAFTFELLENGHVIQTKKNKADGTIQFDAISYATEGTHTYTVREVAGTDTNIDYDSMNATVTVNVTKDAQTGLLNAAVTMPADSEFNNYAVAPVTAQFDFSKALAGRTLKAGEFSFVLKDENGTVLQTKTNDADGKVAFDALTYKNKEVGVHKYTVEEVAGSEAGMTYDPMKAEVTVTVTKAGHTLTATKALPTDTEFNNTFTPAATSAQFSFTKKLEGKALEADAFTFELLENGHVIQTKKNKADGTIQFDAISYATEGTHTYTVREVAGTDTNIDYDSMNATVTVNVTKDAQTGLLNAAVTMPADSEFNNYAVAPVTAQFDFSKALAGRTLKAGEFSFVLKDENGTVLQTKTNDADGKVAFDALTYKNKEVGVHKYTVEEVAGSEAGMTYDPMKAEVTVTVTKDGHTLTATKALPTDTEFNNTFTPAATSAQFSFTKKLEGKALEADAFTFELLENGHVIQTKKNKADGTIQFDAISYATEGTHTYTVREVAGTDTNIDYDSMNATVTVNVTKDAQTGLLNAAVTMPADSEFNNYAVAPVTAQFDFSKALAGRTLKAGEFSFVLKDKNGTVLQTKTNDASGKVAFDALTYKNNEVGEHKYTVEEVAGSEAGMTYDPMKAEVTVTVTKAGHTLTATKALPTDTEFNNTFTPAATSAQFSFTKKLEGKALEADAFTFELLENGHVIQTKKNKADGTIQFDAISYATEGTHTYTVREVAGTDTNIDYDSMNATVTVNVTKDAQTGLLNAAVTMPADSEFNNYAVAPVTAQFDFSKALAGRTLKAGEFSFVLKDENGTVLQTKTNDADGKVAFDALTYKNKEVGVHKYTVEEVAGSEAGMTYDPMKAEVTVTVTKDGHTLTATKALPTDTEFNNTFTPAATSAQFSFTKKLEGKALEADAFTFELLENGHVIQTKKNKADGTIQFDAISYATEGTHTYTVREVAGTDTNIDYDSMNATVTVNVTKDAQTGLLNAAVTMPADSEFNNYAVAPVTAQFDFSKALAGRTLKAGEFSFVLKDENGTVLQTKTNDADGKVAFDALTYKNKEVGVHKYTVEEVAGSEAGMTYDPMKAEVTVTVTKDGHTLTATKALPTDTEFNNTFTPAATSAQFSFTKKLEGKALEADAFTFELLENGHVIQTKKNKADGTIQFDAISYATEGTHTYTVREVAGTDTNIDYDSMNATVTVNVTKDAQTGLLNAAVTMPADSEFNNYAVAPVTVQFNFTKKLEGRKLKAGEFSFVLKDEKGNVIETVTNDVTGKIQFSALTFKRGEEGIYIYHVEEVKGTEAGIEYDRMIATVGIKVKKDGRVLTVTTQLPADTEFNNKVTPPTPSTPPTPPTPSTSEKSKGRELPNTGEQSKSEVVTLGAALGLVGLGLIAKRKKEDEA